MLKFRSTPFEEEIEKATNENNLTEDWALIMHICDNAINYQDGAKFCLKAIMKRLHHNVPRVVLQALTLLDSCVKNCDRKFLLQVASSDFTTEVRKLLSKMHPSAAAKLKELIEKWSLEEFKDDAELCIIPALYYKLKSEGVDFPPMIKEAKPAPPMCMDPDAVSSQEEENDIIKAIEISLKDTGRYHAPVEYGTLGSQILEFSNVPEKFKVRALYDFEAAEDNELTIKSGEIVIILDNSNSSWWKGTNHRGEGLFPANFVTDDLNFTPEEPPVEQQTVVQEVSSDEPSKTLEVKLDEEKIELTINWLNEADPTGEIPDPDEMLLLERECSSMAPLLEDKFQSVDNRLVRLNRVNKEILDSFDLFYSLSDSMFTSHQSTNRSYTAGNYRNNRALTASQISSTVAASTTQQNMATMHGAFYVPAPSVGSQFIMSSELMHSRPICAVQSPHPPQIPAVPTYFHPQLATHIDASSRLSQASSLNMNSIPGMENSVMNSTETPHLHMVPHAGMQYAAQNAPFPPQNFEPGVQNSGFVPGPSQFPNYMTLPYPMGSVGPYFSLPYFYPNSNVVAPNIDTVISSTSNDPSSSQLPAPVKKSPVVTEISMASSRSLEPNYSIDLHQINMGSNDIDTSQTETQYVRTDKSYQPSSLSPETPTVTSGVTQTYSAVVPTTEKL